MHTTREKSKIPVVLMYTGWQMVLRDVPYLALLVQRLD